MLVQHMEDAVRGMPHTVVVEGEAGIGKTALVGELRHAAVPLGTTLLHAAGESLESRSPYYACRTLLRQLLDVDGRFEKRGLRFRRHSVISQQPNQQAGTFGRSRGIRGFNGTRCSMGPGN